MTYLFNILQDGFFAAIAAIGMIRSAQQKPHKNTELPPLKQGRLLYLYASFAAKQL